MDMLLKSNGMPLENFEQIRDMLELIFSENHYIMVNEKRKEWNQGIQLNSIRVFHVKDNRDLDGESGDRKNNHLIIF